MEKENFVWHSYENKQSRPIRVMAKNLHYTCRENSILEDLKSKGFNILNATNKLSWLDNKKPLNMFILTFDNNEDIKKIYEIKKILDSNVTIETIKSNKIIPQCKRCQGFGHTQNYCGKDPRCVKCAGPHLTNVCKKTREAKPKCCHC